MAEWIDDRDEVLSRIGDEWLRWAEDPDDEGFFLEAEAVDTADTYFGGDRDKGLMAVRDAVELKIREVLRENGAI